MLAKGHQSVRLLKLSLAVVLGAVARKGYLLKGRS